MGTYWHTTATDSYTGESRYLRAPTEAELDSKIDRQYDIWEKRAVRLQNLNDIEALTAETERLNDEISSQVEELCGILQSHVSDITTYYQYDKEKFTPNTFRFDVPMPKALTLNAIKQGLGVPEANRFKEFFNRKAKIARLVLEERAQGIFARKTEEYSRDMADYNDRKALARAQFDEEENKRKQDVDTQNQSIEMLKNQFYNGDPTQLNGYINFLIDTCVYPVDCNSICEVLLEYEFEFQSTNKMLVISRKLPTCNLLPRYPSYKFVKTKKEIVPVNWKDKELKKFYENVVFSIVLKTISAIFDKIPSEHLDTIVFNGWVDFVDKKTGNDVTHCYIISLMVQREILSEINLEKVDLKECIKGLKGVFDTNISNLTPVAPVLNLNKEDRRFVGNKDVTDKLVGDYNLATMDWEDFEYLIRQLFEKMFSDNSEVKVTQASRDGGVDAVAFDPDPIRGGKFVIQAKRYNILVPVSAVRDLYGTMMHEGATKGILVTTSEYGKDSYEFAKDKPITLINGQHLLHYLSKYGYNDVKIELVKSISGSSLKERLAAQESKDDS